MPKRRLPKSPERQPLLRIDEAAAELKMSRATVYRLISTGRLASIHVGIAGFARISPADLDAYKAANRRGEDIPERESA